jgi:parallel beta-helix repeat protein
LYISDDNTIKGNTFKDNKKGCIYEDICEGNVFENNECDTDIITIITIVVAIIVVSAIVAIVALLYLNARKKRA